MSECIFCSIAKGETSTNMVYSDDKVMAFLDIQPVNPGHTLVIPRKHAGHLAQLDEETGARLFKAAMHLSEAIRKSGLKCEGINLYLADGEVAGQEISHVHLHVIPRFRGDGFQIHFGRGYGVRPEKADMERIAEKIRVAMR